MAANNALKISDINFDAIKSNLRDFLSSQNELKDYDYDSSTIQTILNLLSYNTYYNSFYLNMVANEMYLDSAIIRDNVISRAKMLGYTPRSARGATAQLTVKITPGNNPEFITVPENTEFTTTIDEITYTFTTLESYSFAKDGFQGPFYVFGTSLSGRGTEGQNGFFYPLYTTSAAAPGTDHSHTFEQYPGVVFYMPDSSVNHAVSTRPTNYINYDNIGGYVGTIDVIEGDRVQESYTVNSNNPSRYILNNSNADTSTLTVTLQESASNTSTTLFTLASDYTNVTASSTVYFLSEYQDETFEVYFGDGIIGQEPRDGNIVRLAYNVVNGDVVNNANTFVTTSTIGGYSNITIFPTSRAQGGDSVESIDSIKLNAPNSFLAQNRAVTANDFKTLILNNFGNIQTVSAWGGEENVPPQYGRVYISAKPRSSLLLSEDTKEQIIDFLADKKTLTVEPILVDADYLYVTPTVNVKFDPDLTDKSSGTIAVDVQNALLNYETRNLGLFNESYINSDVVVAINNTNQSITSVDIDLVVSRRLVPTLSVSSDYTINFNRQLLDISGGIVIQAPEAHLGQGLTLTSSKFTFKGVTVQMDDDGFGNVRLFRLNTQGEKVFETRNIGSINYLTGQIELRNLNITAFEGDYISINVVPDSFDIDPVRNQLVLLSAPNVRVFDANVRRITSTITGIEASGDSTEVQEYGTTYTSY